MTSLNIPDKAKVGKLRFGSFMQSPSISVCVGKKTSSACKQAAGARPDAAATQSFIMVDADLLCGAKLKIWPLPIELVILAWLTPRE